MVLPETSDRKALTPAHFPVPYLAVIWRNWGMVDIGRISAVLQASSEQISEVAALMGLLAISEIPTSWRARGYLTIIRNNWHLLSFDQLLMLLDMSEEQLAFILKEDDFFWHKMGCLKPTVESVVYRPLTDAESQSACDIAACIDADPRSRYSKENAFQFLKRYEGAAPKADLLHPGYSNSMRIIYSYFALYGDPLLDSENDPYPEKLLAEYSSMGINGIWIQGLLYKLVRFPFEASISSGYEKRIKALRSLCERAKKYGIGVYLYLNEPRAMECAFFEKYPHLQGACEGNFYAMCTSTPEVQAYLRDGMHDLLSQVPIAGYFTISMSENLTNCYSRTTESGCTCLRCSQRKPWEVVAEVNNLMAEGAHKANSKVQAIAWLWGWSDKWAEKAVALLDQNQVVMCTSEEGIPTLVGGVPGSVIDYTMSISGPGEKALHCWSAAGEVGLQCAGKVQINNTWELSAVPFIPIFDNIAEHVSQLKATHVDNILMSWTLGGCPSVNLKLAALLLKEDKSKNDILEAFIEETYGSQCAPVVMKAQQLFSRAFSEFPFHVGALYVAPQNYGPMAPFYTEPTGYNATMIGFPYDDLDSWRAIYPQDIFENQFDKLVKYWEEGLLELEKCCKAALNIQFKEFVTIANACACHFRSTLHHIKFVRLRQSVASGQSSPGELQMLLNAERLTVLETIALRMTDSRIGYEASNHYYYSVQDLKEKLLNIEYCRSILCPAQQER